MKKAQLLFILVLIGCSNRQPVQIKTELVNNKSTLKITGTDSTILNDIVRGDTTLLQVLYPVYAMPADTDMKSYQNAQPGKYLLKRGEVFFTPDTPFQKRQTYFLRYANYERSGDVYEIIKKNSRKGNPSYTDYTFTP